MFKNEYKEEMSKQKPSDTSLANIKEEMRKAQRDSLNQHRSAPRYLRAALAVLTSAVIVFSICLPASIPFKEKINVPGSYTELYSKIKSIDVLSGVKYDGFTDGTGVRESVAMAEYNASVKYTSETPEFSETNLQVAGVQEADIIKTDGSHIYAVSTDYIYIVSATDGELEIVSKLNRNENTEKSSSYASEIYITENRLIVISNKYTYSNAKVDSDASTEIFIPDYGQSELRAEIYDITDRAKPTLVNSLGQSGYYTSSRMVGDILYLISSYSVYNTPDPGKPETFVPSLYTGEESELIKAGDICIYDNFSSVDYTVVSGIDTSDDCKIVSNKSMLGFGSNIYANADNLYIASYNTKLEGDTYYNVTDIVRLSLNKGKIEVAANGSVPGNILNQFSMDEYNGVFRIVTTHYSYNRVAVDGDVYIEETALESKSDISVYDETVTSNSSLNNSVNALYTLDLDLNIIGKIENLAPGEIVYSVRFMGDKGYFVTFRRVDPLFCVDLSNPKKPTVLGELKIPGFSEYLHPYSDGLLFGLGKDADEESGRAGFMKLSMFDISDSVNINEKHKLILNGYDYSEASYNHKAILIDSNKKIIAFPSNDKYLVYTYNDNNGFESLAEISLYNNFDEYYYGYYYNMRGLYIDDYLYVFCNDMVSSYSMTDYTIRDSVQFERIKYDESEKSAEGSGFTGYDVASDASDSFTAISEAVAPSASR